MQYVVLIGAAVQILGILSYVKQTLRGATKPNRVSWLLWAAAPIIGTVAALAKGTGWAVLPVFMAGFGPLLVLTVSFRNPKAYWKLGKLDYACGAASVLALVLWAVTKEPLVALAFAIVSDGLAGVPTVVKSWRHPETETVHPYAAGLFGQLTAFLAIQTWTFSEWGFPAYLMLMNLALVGAYYRRRWFPSPAV